ncbi:hypothetical protein ABW19_dt0208361 [Dactylella cylindrospora]|nr:hypothetical protein ABW19_dt0208361 [Dactylella cylindrospora]
MAYFEALDLQLDDSAVLALSEALQSPSMGEFTRQGFVEGWGSGGLGADTIDRMKVKTQELSTSMQTDEAFFKRIYLWTFNWAKPTGQKSLPLDNAIEWWKLLFANKFAGHLDSWISFLTEEWKKSIAKDTWNMLYDFVKFAEGDPSLASYDELGSWPSVIDGYVAYHRRKLEE